MSFESAHRIVIKIGSSLLVDSASGALRQEWLAAMANDIAELHQAGKEIVIVTSGAVALGRKLLKNNRSKLLLEEKQAAAACGQIELVGAYQRCLGASGLAVAQILLTIEDSEDRRRYLNARTTLETLIEQRIIPVINENDTVATAELRFGDNDRLAARVAQMVSADLLVLLSDVDGLYTANPAIDPKARHIPVVAQLTSDIEAMAGGVSSNVGTGGMVTKLQAAKIATSSGCHMLIALGKQAHPLQALQKGAKHTLFKASSTPLSARKYWIASRLHPAGEILVDDGAVNALLQGKSLLPAGVREVRGEFERGDSVVIRALDGREIGKGLSAYNTQDAKAICGKKTVEIEAILGYAGRQEIVHRDDLVLY